MPTKHSQRHVIGAFLDEAWMIHEPKLREIVGFLEIRAAGMTLSPDQVREVTQRQQAASFAQTLAAENDDEDKPVIVDGVQVLQLFGTLAPRMNLLMEFSGGTSTQKFSEAVAKAAANPKVKTILIEVDSPGGAVSGTEEARQAILRAKEAGKRVVVVGRNLMASAAYYIGAAATEVYATPSTEVGSVGVYAVISNEVKAAEEAGVKYYVLRAGDLKAAGNPYEELTPERQAALQKRVDDPYAMFLAAVATDRRVSIDTVKQTFGRGSVFLADEAKRVGMIDGVAMIEDVFQQEKARARSAGGVAPGFRAAAAAIFQQKEEKTMTKKIKAALFARGLVDSPDAEDAVCQVALSAFLAARGVKAETEDAKLAALLADNAKADDAPPAPAAVDARHREVEEAKVAARAAERQRVADLTASAETLQVSAEDLKAAIDAGIEHEAALKGWVENLAKKEKALPKGTITPGGAGEDRWAADAVDALRE